jgi:uncharacterized membrane protein YvbJ
MFCAHCGKPDVVDDAVICIGCGRSITPIKPSTPVSTNIPLRGDNNLDLTIRIVVAMLLPLIGLILGLVGYHQKRVGSFVVIVVSFVAFIFWLMVLPVITTL